MDYLKENYKKILTIIISIVMIFSAYFLLTPSEDSVTLDIAQANRTEVNRTVQMLKEVKRIKLKKEIFTDGIFTSLQDTETTLPEYEVGKANPFIPIATSTRLDTSSEEQLDGSATVGEDGVHQLEI